MTPLIYTTKSFDQLTLLELYDIMRLRQEVFVVEQECPYLDADGKDIKAMHVLGTDPNGSIQAYTRLLDRGISYDDYPSIGRVINSAAIRGSGEGKRLMQYSIEQIKNLYPGPIKIGAQAYLKRFYEGFGFVDMDMPYLEDGIPHLIMVLD
jgi:ElaA protein